MKSQKISLGIHNFASWWGNNFVPAAIELFKAKVIDMLQYGYQICSYKNFPGLEQIQTQFLKSITHFPYFYLIQGSGKIMLSKILGETSHLGNLTGTPHSMHYTSAKTHQPRSEMV